MKSLIRFTSHLLPTENPKFIAPWSRYRHGCDPPERYHQLIVRESNFTSTSRINFHVSIPQSQNGFPISVTLLSYFQNRFFIRENFGLSNLRIFHI